MNNCIISSIITYQQFFEIVLLVLGQFPPKKTAPNPKPSHNPNPNPNRGQILSGQLSGHYFSSSSIVVSKDLKLSPKHS